MATRGVPGSEKRILRGLRRLVGLRARDSRDALFGFLTLLFAIAGHSVLEAARDALFLQSLPVARLPWAYLTIAGLTFLGSALGARLLERFSRARALAATLLGGACITSAFVFMPAARASTVALMAFYVWAGTFATSVVIQFWLLAGEVMDFGQAKRSYAFLGAGALVGAVLGSSLASLVLLVTGPRSLPLVAALLFLVASTLPRRFARSSRIALGARARATDAESARRRMSGRETLSDPYLRRVLVLVLLGTISVTLADFVFKSVVVREVGAESLPAFFARYYALLNALALGFELFVTPRLLRMGGVQRVLLAMPILVFGCSLGFAVSGGLAAALLLKGVDGSFRHSMNRIGTEILYLPLRRELREPVRVFIEAAGLRGGQALASVVVLAGASLGVGVPTLAIVLIGFAGLWMVAARGIEGPYFGRFRLALARPTRGAFPEVSAPSCEPATLEARLSALHSNNEEEVREALETFALWGKAALVPSSILRHPSEAVVLRALDVFTRSGRSDLAPLVSELCARAHGEVRVAALRFAAEHCEDASALLHEAIAHSDSAVRATALLGLMRRGALDQARAAREVRVLLESGDLEARHALAAGIGLLPPDAGSWLLDGLLEREDGRAVDLAAQSIARHPHPALGVRLERALFERAAKLTCLRYLVETALQELALRDRSALELLGDRLALQSREALERAFELLQGLDPTAPFADVLSAVQSSDPDACARGLELFEHLAPHALPRALIEGVLENAPLRFRVAHFGPLGLNSEYAPLIELARAKESSDPARRKEVQRVLAATLGALENDADRSIAGLAQRALETLESAESAREVARAG